MFEALYVLLRERVQSPLGMLRQQPPPRPDFCTFAGHKNPSSAFAQAEAEWNAGLCGLERWTTIEQLDAHLMAAG